MRNLALYVVALFVALALTMANGAEPAKPARLDPAALMDASRFARINSVADLPKPVRDACVGSEGAIANPAEPFNAGCTIGPGSPPSNRLIWAAFSARDQVYVLHFERGGVAHTFNVLAVQLRGDAVSGELRFAAQGRPIDDYAAFVAAVKAHTLAEMTTR